MSIPLLVSNYTHNFSCEFSINKKKKLAQNNYPIYLNLLTTRRGEVGLAFKMWTQALISCKKSSAAYILWMWERVFSLLQYPQRDATIIEFFLSSVKTPNIAQSYLGHHYQLLAPLLLPPSRVYLSMSVCVLHAHTNFKTTKSYWQRGKNKL